MKLIFATKNSGKTRSCQKRSRKQSSKLKANKSKDRGRAGTGSSFLENALIKCKSVSETTGRPTIADDSGLVVPALNGRPGIYSARYSDREPVMRKMFKSSFRNKVYLRSQAYFFVVWFLWFLPMIPFPSLLKVYGKEKFWTHQQVRAASATTLYFIAGIWHDSGRAPC